MSETFLLDQRSVAFAEDYVPASEQVSAARRNAIADDAPAPSNGVTTALTFLAKALDATAVVEIGTGTGTTGLALFEGMNPNGVLTSIDSEVDWQLDAKQTFRDNQIPSQRFRLISGRPLDVLNNLRDGAYDLVLINADKLEYVEYVAQAERLLRSGGIAVINDALWQDLVADPADETDETVIIREALTAVQEAEIFTPLLLPLGEGLLAAVKN
ncbi:class I SAM-dependent methyltransferase [Propionimicrobium sp. PCR01-08-3]|uniref:O-methyltransferase n=1 Tax=Propionimicrobium sp. PCR01-08-3 TaxID=3052086 RepID=UPI00255CAF82|nr:class I SAM-dependent methyltransferase [Propionimicrobium sp. PCR01-08-3]WIY81797.1 class I SAM-dependent methyltransferase [Propionimicrobium sp. PCR01-08-3]